MLMIREQLARVASDRVTRHEDGTYACSCGAGLTDEVRRHSLWIYPLPGGPGKVVPVRYLYCQACQPEYHASNEEGTPIYDIQLMNVDGDLMPTEMEVREVGLLAKTLESRGAL